MRRLHLLIVVVLSVASLIAPAATTARDQRLKFEAKLSGREEFPDPRNTPASGRATFELSKDGKTLSYKLKVDDIRNVFAAHIHQGAKGENGPVDVDLFSGSTGSGEFKGTLARGTITAANLKGPLAGKTLADLLAQMLTGNTYVNVHTNDGNDPPNTGPGDFPGGEIRGQIQRQ